VTAFTNIARTNTLRPRIVLTNTELRAYEHVNKSTLTNLMIYLMKKKKKLNVRIFNLETHFKEHILFLCWGSPVTSLVGVGNNFALTCFGHYWASSEGIATL
jgi:hypothetical protein